MSDLNQISIKAKKISKINSYDNQFSFNENKDKTYLLITYAPENSDPQNFKIPLNEIIDRIKQSVEVISEEDILNQLINILNNNETLNNRIKGEPGESAYEIAKRLNLTNAENETEWVESLNNIDTLKELISNNDELKNLLKGPKGDPGKSAYQSYVETTTDYPILTEYEWIESFKESVRIDNEQYIDNKIQLLENKINNYHKERNIIYNLTNVLNSQKNPLTTVGYNILTLYFTPAPGYILPNQCTISGVESYFYDKSNGVLTITKPDNSDSDIIINLNANAKIKYYFQNGYIDTMEYVYATLDDSIENIYMNDQFAVNLSINVDESLHILPEIFECDGCEQISYNKNTHVLILKCTGSKNVMSIKANTTDISSYIFSYGLGSNSDIFIKEDNVITDINWNNILELDYTVSTTGVSPIDFVLGITWNNLVDVKGEDVYIIIPATFYNINKNEFINNNNDRYKMIDTFGNVLTPLSDIIEIMNDNIKYYIYHISNNGVTGKQLFRLK